MRASATKAIRPTAPGFWALSFVAGLLAIGAMLAIGAGAAHASDHCDIDVPGDHATIQDAIDAADAGDTICVEAGTYAENLALNALKSDITLEGAKAGVPAGPDASPANRGSDESVIQGTVEITQSGATGITVDGFAIDSGTLHGVRLRGSSHTIVNNMLEAAFTDNVQAGIFSHDFSDAYVAHNNFRDYRQGMNLDGGVGNLPSTIEGNYLTGSRLSTVFFQGSGANGHIITGNVLEDNPGTGILVTQGQHEISENTIVGSGGNGISLVNVPANALRTFDLEITGNVIQGNFRGVNFGAATVPTPGGHEVNGNCIEGNPEAGLRNLDEMSPAVDATLNWWGASDGPSGLGPGSGDAVVGPGPIVFVPFLTTPDPCPAPPAPPDPTTADECKKGGWEDHGFKNQGQCIRFVNTGKDSR